MKKPEKKIVTLGSDYKKKLLENIDPGNLPKMFGGDCECKVGCMYSNAGPWNKTGKVSIDLELINKLKKEEEQNEEGVKIEDNAQKGKEEKDDEEDDEDRGNLAELSKQLNDNMKLSKGHSENAKYKLEDAQDDNFGETPINTEENGAYDD